MFFPFQNIEVSVDMYMQEGALTQNSNGVIGDVIVCKGWHCTGTITKKKSLHHWLPSIHEDYNGPRRHRPKHH